MTTTVAHHGSPALADALEHCRLVTRARARNFYYGLKLAPEPARSALFAIYAWMRAADDLVDQPGALAASPPRDELLQRIAEFRTSTDAALAGTVAKPRVAGVDERLWFALADVAQRYALPAHCFQAMLDGQVQDLDKPRFETFQDVYEYCYRVASTVGLLCIEIWGYDDARARDLAVQRGIAFQLTNILRDVKQDWEAGRVYLPLDELAAHGLSAQSLVRWEKPVECRSFLLAQLERAAQHYRRSEPLDGMIDPACRPTLWAMTTIYRGLLDRMMHDPQAIVGTRRIRLSAARKALIALRAKLMSRAGNRSSRAAAPPIMASRNTTA